MSRRRPEPIFEKGDRVLIVTQHWLGKDQRGTVRHSRWIVGNWRYDVRLDGRRENTDYNATSLRRLSAVDLLGELA